MPATMPVKPYFWVTSLRPRVVERLAQDVDAFVFQLVEMVHASPVTLSPCLIHPAGAPPQRGEKHGEDAPAPQRGLFRNGWERPLRADALGRFETAPRPRLPFLDGQRGADRETPNPGGVDLDMSAQREAVRWQAHAV